MAITRRAATAALGAALFTPYLSRAAERGARQFRIIRDGDDIGFQSNAVRLIGDVIAHECEVSIQVKVFGITAYRYEMSYAEEWRGGQLISLESTCNDDGDPFRVTARRTADVLEIDGTGFQGVQSGEVATTSYWAFPFLSRPVWISTQSGEPFQMQARKAGGENVAGPGGTVNVDKWVITGGYEVDALYSSDEWMGIEFDAGGERARYIPDNVEPQFMPVWNAA